MAEKESWRVQAEAEQLLAEKLKERSESETRKYHRCRAAFQADLF